MDVPMANDHPDALRAFLWGKRGSRRHPLALDVEVQAAFGDLQAMSIDVSGGGVLLRVPVAALAPDAAADGDVDPYLLVQTHFRGPCVARFPKCGVKAHIEAVRLDLRADEPDFLYVGCKFSRPLDAKQLRRFGLGAEECAAEIHALPSELMPLHAANDPCVARLFVVGGPNRPVFEGRVLAIGEGTLCMRVEGDHATLAAVGLGAKRLRIEVLAGDKVAWDASAWLRTIGFPSEDPTELELGLVTVENPGAALDNWFEAASA